MVHPNGVQKGLAPNILIVEHFIYLCKILKAVFLDLLSELSLMDVKNLMKVKKIQIFLYI